MTEYSDLPASVVVRRRSSGRSDSPRVLGSPGPSSGESVPVSRCADRGALGSVGRSSRARGSNNGRSAGNHARSCSWSGPIQRSASCEPVLMGSPRASRAAKTIRCSPRRIGTVPRCPVSSTSMSNSSRASRIAACSAVSPGSTPPPGNSQPPRAVAGPIRRPTRTSPSRMTATAATVRRAERGRRDTPGNATPWRGRLADSGARVLPSAVIVLLHWQRFAGVRPSL